MDAALKSLNLSKLWEYDGQINNNNMRYGFGKEKWRDDETNQKYEGYYHLNCFNGSGQFSWGSLTCYEGSFYANDIHGYGCMSFADGSFFEGLFKENQRFGPGIHTWSDGSQDVGLWIENQLVRLSTNLTKGFVPTLAESFDAKIYLNKYKKLISISAEKTPSRLIFEEINALDLKKFENYLYSNLVRNSSSLFFNKSEFDKNSMNTLSKFSVSSDPFQEKTEILAWNNEKELISLMEYIYKNHGNEKELSFNILEVLNDRDNFGPRGYLEIVCEEFFNSVIERENQISKLIMNYDLNPDLCDVHGNTAVHCAVCMNNLLDLRTLIDFGASIDRFNDECLTPLLLCLLRYLEAKENVTNWEAAFLPQISSDQTKQPYILDLSCKVVKLPDKKKKERKIKVRPTTRGAKKRGAPPEPPPSIDPSKTRLEEKLIPIRRTIKEILDYGADPNLGENPFPPFLLSLFTLDESIIQDLLAHGADVKLKNSHQDGSLSPLHIVASMKPSPEQLILAQILLDNGANLNPRANENHWVEEKLKLDPDENFSKEEKTPLHLLAMRYDFLEDEKDYLGMLYEKMVQVGCDPNLQYYGHTCLSLAVLRGNLRLMERILKSGTDPNQLLGWEVGVPLTVLILKRYKYYLPLYACQEVYDLLFKYKANPFYPVNSRGWNSFELCEEENRVEVVGKKKPKKDPHDKVIEILYKAAQSLLDRQIMAKAIKLLYSLKIECDFTHPLFNHLVQFLDVPETKRILQILINNDQIQVHGEKIKSLLAFVQSENSAKNVAEKSPKTPKSKTSSKKEENTEDLFGEFAQNLKKQPVVVKKLHIPDPEVDEAEEKYRVCYNCFKKTGKVLILCPVCELVYFCSIDCNKNNMKKKTRHCCNNLFYTDELRMIEAGIFRPLVIEEFQKRKNLIFKKFLSSYSSPLTSSERNGRRGILRNFNKSKHSSVIEGKKKEARKPRTV